MDKTGQELKRNRFDIAPQALMLAAGVILSVILISVMVAQFERARDLSGTVTRKMIDDANKIALSDIMQYDGVTVTGADVRNFYRKYLSSDGSEVGILSIDNGKNVIGYENSGSYANLVNPDDRAFVSASDLYLGKVMLNENGVVIQVVFTKKQ